MGSDAEDKLPHELCFSAVILKNSGKNERIGKGVSRLSSQRKQP